MRQILTYNEIDRVQWSALVEGSATGTWFQTPEAYAFYASQTEIMRPFVFAVRGRQESGSLPAKGTTIPGEKGKETLRAVCCGYVTKEKNPLKQYFTRRAIIIGGPVLADDCSPDEVSELLNAVRNGAQERNDATSSNDELMRPIYIETRNFNDYSRWKEAFERAGFRYQPHLNYHFYCTDKDSMRTKLSETRRRQINKSVKSGTTIEEARTEEEITEWYAILSDLYRRRVKTPLFPLPFFLEFFRQKRGVYLLVKYEGRVIGGMMCPINESKCIYEWFVCGLDTAYKEQYPSVMATWAAMVYAHEHGIPKFDIMGAGVPGVPYGVRDFKAEFGGTMVEYGRFLHVAKPLLYRIGEAGVAFLKRQ